MLDASLLFEPVTGTAITVTADSTNTLDMLVARDVGVGNTLELHVGVITAFVAAGAATLTIDFQESADNITFHSLLISNVYPKTALTVGTKIFRYVWPRDQQLNTLVAPGRYYKLVYTVATGPFTAGKILAYVTGDMDRNDQYFYPNNYSVDV